MCLCVWMWVWVCTASGRGCWRAWSWSHQGLWVSHSEGWTPVLCKSLCLYPLSCIPNPYYFLFFASDWSFAYFSSLVYLPYGQPQPLAFSSAWVLGQPTDWPTLPASHLLCTYSCIISRTLFKDCIEFVKKQGNLSPWIEILLLRQLALSWDHSLQAWCLTGSWPLSEPSLATGSLCPRLEHHQTGKGSFFVKGLPLLSLSTSFSSVSRQAFWGWVM